MNDNNNIEKRFYHHPYFKQFIQDIFLPAFLFVFLIPGMIIRPTYIPSPSMNPTLMEGDKLILSKVHYGPKTPQTLLQLPFFAKKYSNLIQLPSYRLPGFSKLSRGACVVFNCPLEIEDPVDMRTWWVKRLIGMPNDVVSLNAGQVYINGTPFILPKGVETQQLYIVILKGFRHSSKGEKFLRSLGVSDITGTDTANSYGIHVTERLAQELRENKDVVSVQRFTVSPIKRQKDYFAYGDYFAVKQGGSVDYMPKVKVPAKGMEIEVSKENLQIYAHVILHHEGHKKVEIDEEKGTLTIDGVPLTTYTFAQNYYFMMGDNRGNSHDSRAIGFIPEDHVVGKPVLVLVSNKKKYFLIDLLTLNIRWNRFFKLIK